MSDHGIEDSYKNLFLKFNKDLREGLFDKNLKTEVLGMRQLMTYGDVLRTLTESIKEKFDQKYVA